MDHVAIDLGARKSQICVRSADGEIVEEKRLETWDLKHYLAGRPKSRERGARKRISETLGR
jgi:hypothetical protein